MLYPLTVNISTVQMSENSDIYVSVGTRAGGEGHEYKRTEFRLRPLDTPDDVENYVMMAVAAVCEAL